MTTRIFPVALLATGEPRHFGAELAEQDDYTRFSYTPERLLVTRTSADVLSARVEYVSGDRVELLLLRPQAAAAFGPNSTVARKLQRQDVVMHPGDRLVVEFDAHATGEGEPQLCMLGSGFEQPP